MTATMAAARCVRGLWTNPVLSMRISSRLVAQPAGLFSSESGKIFRASRTFRFLKMALDQPCCSLNMTLKNLSTFKSPVV